MHYPVLLQTVIDFLNIKEKGLYIDATLGEGSYTEAILKKSGRVLSIDLDSDQIKNYGKRFAKSKNLVLEQGNFADIKEIARKHHFEQADGIVFDLGLSMEQIARSGRGFSFKGFNEPLDMRIDINTENTAAFFINTLSKEGLYNLFAKNSEEINSQKIANMIVGERVKKRIHTVGDLVRAIDKAIGESDTAIYRRIFQALRIEVNQEFANLKKGLKGALEIVNDKGRIVIVTFHSLEDRIVKKFIKENKLFEIKKTVKIINKKTFERSAKLRIFSKLKLI